MKIVHLTTVHPAFDSRIFYKECRALHRIGFEVILIACHETNEKVQEIQIHHLEKPKNRAERMSFTLWKAFRACLQTKAELYHFHDPELIPVAFLLRLLGKKIIYDVHEDLPSQIQNKYWIPKPLRFLFSVAARWVEWLGGQTFSGIVAATPGIAERFPKPKTVTIQNFPVPEELVPLQLLPYRERPNQVAYIGAITKTRGLEEMVTALSLLPSDLKTRLTLVGQFSPTELKNEGQRMEGWAHIDYLGYRVHPEIPEILNRSRIGLAILHPTPSYVNSYPIKLFEYLSAGLPVIVSDFPLWRQLLKGFDCALFVDPLNPKAIAEAIAYLLTHEDIAESMGARGRQLVLERYNWKSEEAKLSSFYREVLNPS